MGAIFVYPVQQLPDVVKLTLEAAFKEHQRWLAQWQTQVSELGRVIGADIDEWIATDTDVLSNWRFYGDGDDVA